MATTQILLASVICIFICFICLSVMIGVGYWKRKELFGNCSADLKQANKEKAGLTADLKQANKEKAGLTAKCNLEQHHNLCYGAKVYQGENEMINKMIRKEAEIFDNLQAMGCAGVIEVLGGKEKIAANAATKLANLPCSDAKIQIESYKQKSLREFDVMAQSDPSIAKHEGAFNKLLEMLGERVTLGLDYVCVGDITNYNRLHEVVMYYLNGICPN